MTDHVRNTREAPKLDRCDTCGATKLDGNGSIRRYKDEMACKRCRRGRMHLERGGWRKDPDTGKLQPPAGTPEQPSLVRERADADQLHAAMVAMAEGTPLTVEPPLGGRGFVAVVLPNGFRFHVYGRHMDPTGQGEYTARLFSPGRELLPIYQSLGPNADDAAEVLMAMAISSRVIGQPVMQAIEEFELHQAEVDMFDPHALLDDQ